MSEQQRSKLGWLLLGGIWIICGVVAAAVATLIFLHVEGRYLVGPERTEDVSIVKLEATAQTPAGAVFASTYSVRLASGATAVVQVAEPVTLQPGDRVRLTYVRTRIRGELIVKNVQQLQ